MKTLQEVLDYQNHQAHTDPAWKASGFGPTSWSTVRSLLGKTPMTTDATDHPMNIDQDFKKKLMDFFDVLGDILMQEYPHDTSVFDMAGTHTKDGHRPADRMVGEAQNPDEWLEKLKGDVNKAAPDIGGDQEDAKWKEAQEQGYDPMSIMQDPRFQNAVRRHMENNGHQEPDGDEDDGVNEAKLLSTAFSVINEAIVQEVGRLYDATVAIRGMQRTMKVFFPSMSVASRRDLQESLNKVFDGAVVLKMTPSADQNTRITKAPFVILEDARYHIVDNLVIDADTDTILVLEKCSKSMKKKKKKAKKEASPMVKEAFERYKERLLDEADTQPVDAKSEADAKSPKKTADDLVKDYVPVYGSDPKGGVHPTWVRNKARLQLAVKDKD